MWYGMDPKTGHSNAVTIRAINAEIPGWFSNPRIAGLQKMAYQFVALTALEIEQFLLLHTAFLIKISIKISIT